ncbi:N-acyl-D-amino-acid deacylase family protein [Uniformispora flossi]|uniref:N-acyl-D-amino-acid deacylase family protein n=1 Tax=Uniformispora flossi TaxID=3390723 RepID=UPI003C2FDBB3
MHDLVIRGGTVADGTGNAVRTGDIAVDGDRITAVGGRVDAGRRELDADGLLVTPGFVDIHTHYDAQATWDALLTSSCWHGVTTVVTGNCGVGFAPVRPDRRDWFVEVMESVEDIPAPALRAALAWDWETFPEFLDALDRLPHALDIAALLPHAALRVYVMGARGADPHAAPRADELGAMTQLVREAAEAGAVGFATSRTEHHRTGDGGLLPCHALRTDELAAVAAGLVQAGGGVLEVGSDFPDGDLEAEFAGYRRIAAESGLHMTMPVAESPSRPGEGRRLLDLIEQAAADGVPVSAQVTSRPIGAVFGMDSRLHPFAATAAWRRAGSDPAVLRRGDVRAAVLGEARAAGADPRLGSVFRIAHAASGFPVPADALGAEAAAAGADPLAFLYDALVAGDGTALFYRPAVNYDGGDDRWVERMLRSPHAVPGLGDGGAHCSMISDMSSPTTLLTYWGRDRPSGALLPVPWLVKRQTADAADLVGLHDRGRLAPGMKADINLIDFTRLRAHAPEMAADLPAGGRRLVQRADGYRHMVVSGEVAFTDGEHTGAMPGRVVRRT